MGERDYRDCVRAPPPVVSRSLVASATKQMAVAKLREVVAAAADLVHVSVQSGLSISTSGATLGGRDGTIVVASTHPRVQKGWRVIAVNDCSCEAADAVAALEYARRSGRPYRVTLSRGQDSGSTSDAAAAERARLTQKRLQQAAKERREAKAQRDAELEAQRAAESERAAREAVEANAREQARKAAEAARAEREAEAERAKLKAAAEKEAAAVAAARKAEERAEAEERAKVEAEAEAQAKAEREAQTKKKREARRAAAEHAEAQAREEREREAAEAEAVRRAALAAAARPDAGRAHRLGGGFASLPAERKAVAEPQAALLFALSATAAPTTPGKGNAMTAKSADKGPCDSARSRPGGTAL